MKIRNTLTAILGFISFSSGLLSSGVKESADWLHYAMPFIWVAIITGLLALIIYNWNSIRRITYPLVVCLWAWLYEHKILTTTFAQNTYSVYSHLGKSYKKFFITVQNAFDRYLILSSKV